MHSLHPYLLHITNQHPDWDLEEIEELSQEYFLSLDADWSEEKKFRAILKRLDDNFDSEYLETYLRGQYDIDAIPKHLFGHTNIEDKKDDAIRITHLHKRLGTTVLFNDANVQIKCGDHIALIGRNGTGKSTLLKMIIGKEPIDKGRIVIKPGLRVGYLSQDLFREHHDRMLQDEMLTTLPEVTQTVQRLAQIEKLLADGDERAGELVDEQSDLIERMVHHDGYRRYDMQIQILKYFGFTREQLQMEIGKLSGGEQTKVQIAKFLIQEVDILVLDEPTNHLDIEGIIFLEKVCRAWGKTLICISHDKQFLQTSFDKVIEIRSQQLSLYHGDYDHFLQQKQKDYELQSKNYAVQQKYLEQQERFIERFRYKPSKASQVQSRIKMLEKLERVEEPEMEQTGGVMKLGTVGRLPNVIMRLHLTPDPHPNPNPLPRREREETRTKEKGNIEWGVGRFWEKGEKKNELLIQLPPVIEVTKEMKIGVVGANGVGKTTLIRAILGEIPLFGGKVMINERMQIGSYSQIIQSLDHEAIAEDMLAVDGKSTHEARKYVGMLAMDTEKLRQRVGTLSGGERAKIALAKMLLTQPHVIIMDEPTNHLDIQSKETMTSMLQLFDGVTIIVSHDRAFLREVSNILRMIRDQQLTVYQNVEKGLAEMGR